MQDTGPDIDPDGRATAAPGGAGRPLSEIAGDDFIAVVTTPPKDSYALGIANDSYRWYVTASKRSRRSYRITDVSAVLISASIPVAAVIAPDIPTIPAVLGAVLVIIAGVRAIFHWPENYLRFSRAREAVEEQRRLYHVSAPPFHDPATRDEELVKAVTRIEQAEMGQWAQIADPRPARKPDPNE
ncbi:DUF4231 domain-containing protein [Dactylosporangium sp. NPDC005572]|uniref:DUF4231 domain-containing protein n=1 Tax=Dactylosporangium sp. NPDC005572 TaxID=3156889 RepID=UPI0033AAF2AB